MKARFTAVTKRPSYFGFTLMELLIVIAILAVLALLIFGLSSKMTQKAKKVASINSMRQVAVATLAFSGDNNGKLNRVIDKDETSLLLEPIPGQGDRWVSNTFWGRLHPYLFSDLPVSPQSELSKGIGQRLLVLLNTKNVSTMQGTPFQGSSIYADTSGLRLPFGFNKEVFESGTPGSSYAEKSLKRIHSIDDSARVVYFSYGSFLFDESDGKLAVPPPIKTPASQSNIYWFQDKTAAFTFIDGHVEVLKPPLAKERFE